jgi:hypothetical protein
VNNLFSCSFGNSTTDGAPFLFKTTRKDEPEHSKTVAEANFDTATVLMTLIAE